MYRSDLDDQRGEGRRQDLLAAEVAAAVVGSAADARLVEVEAGAAEHAWVAEREVRGRGLVEVRAAATAAWPSIASRVASTAMFTGSRAPGAAPTPAPTATSASARCLRASSICGASQVGMSAMHRMSAIVRGRLKHVCDPACRDRARGVPAHDGGDLRRA